MIKSSLLLLLATTLAAVAADSTETKPAKEVRKEVAGRAALVPDVDGVAKEDMAKFRAAFAKAQQDEAVKAAREKQLEKRKSLEFATAAEKKDARADLEALAEELRKATRSAIAKADGTLSKETIEKIADAVEDKLKERAKLGAKKGGDAKTPAKPFPFGDKGKSEEKKPEAAAGK